MAPLPLPADVPAPDAAVVFLGGLKTELGVVLDAAFLDVAGGADGVEPAVACVDAVDEPAYSENDRNLE